MSLIRDLYSRFAHIGVEGIKFCVVGGVGAIAQFGIQNTLHSPIVGIELGPLTSNTLGVIGGIVVTFFGNRYWTYAHKRSHGTAFFRETWLFLLWAFIGWGIQDGLLAAGTYGLQWKSGIEYNVITAFGIGVATVFRFWAYRTFVFTGRRPPAAPVDAERLEAEPTS